MPRTGSPCGMLSGKQQKYTRMDYISLILALAVVAIPVTSLIQRIKGNKGIGWQFIRFNVIAIALPLAALLAMNNALTEGAVAIIAGGMGYAFGKQGEKD